MNKLFIILFLTCSQAFAVMEGNAVFIELLGQSGGIGINVEQRYNNFKIRYGLSTAVLAFGAPLGFDYCLGDRNEILTGFSVIPSFFVFKYFDAELFFTAAISGNVAYRRTFENNNFIQLSFNPTYLKILSQDKTVKSIYYIIPWFGFNYGWSI